jgi:hypothetical protein
MKKLLLFLFFITVSLGLNAQNFNKNWEKSAGNNETGYAFFATSGTNVNSCAYNPITDKLYVANRQVGINIINPATGAIIGSLNITGITLAGSLAFHKIRVTPTGEIFAASLKTSTANGNTFVYHWVNEAAAPVLLGNSTTGITLLSERSADAFAVSGSGNDVVLYFGGSGTTNLQRINKNTNGDFVSLTNIVLDNVSAARSSISPVTTGASSDFYISGSTVQKRKISSSGLTVKAFATGNLVGGNYTATNAISNKFASLEYFEAGTKKFIAATGANDNPITGEGLAFHVYDVTDVDNITLVASTKLTNTFNSNTTPGTDIAIKKVVNVDLTTTVALFQLVNHNGLASYSLIFNPDGTLPVELTSFNAAIKKSKNTLTWTTASESNNSGFDIESSTDGSGFNKISFVATKAVSGNSNAVLTYSFEDAKAAKGTTYYRLKQVDFNGDFKYSDVKFINNSLNNAVQFSVYPNPVTNVIRVGTTLQDLNGYQVDLYNTNGLKVKSLNLVDGNSIDVSDLSSDIYLLKITKDKSLVQTLKLVKQ